MAGLNAKELDLTKTGEFRIGLDNLHMSEKCHISKGNGEEKKCLSVRMYKMPMSP